MVTAAQNALKQADPEARQIDLVIGDTSISEYLMPNAVSGLHHRLGLAPRVLPVALTSGFSQFNLAMMMADALIRAGRATYVLIALGDNWTQFVDYPTGESYSAGDGAAACVVRPARTSADWSYVDSRTISDTSNYGTMFMASDPVPYPGGQSVEFSLPTFHRTDAGLQGFKAFGQQTSGEAALDLLNAHPKIRRDATGQWTDVCLITHQASQVLSAHWKTQINPGNVVQTLEKIVDMVHCSLPLNLA
jgi:3-oxoacyl-[acyl-carrier-protein] synthase III